MNTNPKAKTILCYGDSNTWGRMPDRSGRYDAATRWTGQLQDMLGYDFYVIEEGLGGRTTNLDDPDSIKNGLTYLIPCLKSHTPLDYIVIMLGTNDFKFRFKRTAEDVANAIAGMIDTVKSMSDAKILIVSPATINPSAPRFDEFYSEYYDGSAGEKSTALGDKLQTVARMHNCLYLDAATIVKTGEDGVHLDQASLNRLSNEISKTLMQPSLE